MNSKKLSLSKIIEELQKKETFDDKILFLCCTFRYLKALKLRNFYLYSVKKSFQFQSGYLALLVAAIIFLLLRQQLSSLFCLVPSMFLYFSPIMAKNLLERARKKSLYNSRLLPALIKKYHSDYKALRIIKAIINPFHFKRLS